MKKRVQLLVLGALASGMLAGLMIARLRAPSPSAYVLPPPEPPLRLPPAPPRLDARAKHPVPMTYEMLPVAVRARRPSPGAVLPFSVIALVVLLASAITLMFARPHVSLVAPQSALAGRPASILYSTTGVGNATYIFTGSPTHGASALAKREGAIVLPIVPSAVGHDIVIALRMDGLLGHDLKVARIHVLPAPRIQRVPDALRIDALAVQSPSVRSGGVIPVHYRTNAAQGMLTLSGASGSALQHVPIDGSGIARFTAPTTQHDRPLIVSLHAERNGHSLVASAGVIVVAAVQKPKASPLTAMPNFFVPPTVHSGGTIRITLPRGLANVTITLFDRNGHVFAQTWPGWSPLATLIAPNVVQRVPLTVTIKYAVGRGSETLLRPVTVIP